MDKCSFRYESAFERNLGWLSGADQDKLRKARIMIAGLGGTGGFQAQALARLGVGNFTLVDPDTFEISNINRQIGASIQTIGKKKVDVIRDMILSINPEAKIKIMPVALTESNQSDALESADMAIDGIDFFEVDTKLNFFSGCIRKNVPVLTAGPIGFGVALIVFSREGMDPYAYFDIHEAMSKEDREFALAFGLTPVPLCLPYMDRNALNLEGHRAASVCPGLMLSGAITGVEAVKILTGKGKVAYAPHVYQIDLFTQKVSKRYFRWGMRSPWMRLKRMIVKKIALGKKG